MVKFFSMHLLTKCEDFVRWHANKPNTLSTLRILGICWKLNIFQLYQSDTIWWISIAKQQLHCLDGFKQKVETLYKSAWECRFLWCYLDYGLLECDTVKSVNGFQHFGETCCLHPQDGQRCQDPPNLIAICHTTWTQSRKHNLNSYRRVMIFKLTQYKLFYSFHFQFFTTKGVQASSWTHQASYQGLFTSK
jgi:hypothetical protein